MLCALADDDGVIDRREARIGAINDPETPVNSGSAFRARIGELIDDGIVLYPGRQRMTLRLNPDRFGAD